MLRTTRIFLGFAGLVGVLALGLLPAVAEKPHSTPAQLAKRSTHIVRGTVERVFERARRHGKSLDTDYVAEVKVAAVEKGEGIRLDRPLYVRYWSKEWQGPGMPPARSSGHSQIPGEGAAVRLYLARNAYDGFGTERHDGGYNVLGKNGIQKLSAEEVRKAEAETKPVYVPAFPESWGGVWGGELASTKPGLAAETARTFIAFGPTDDPKRFEFRFRHGETGEQSQYELVSMDAPAGRYAIDRKDGTTVPAAYVGEELVWTTSEDGTVTVARYRRVGDFLTFERTQIRDGFVQQVQRAELRR